MFAGLLMLVCGCAWAAGGCEQCSEREEDEPYCRASGYKEVLRCVTSRSEGMNAFRVRGCVGQRDKRALRCSRQALAAVVRVGPLHARWVV